MKKKLPKKLLKKKVENLEDPMELDDLYNEAKDIVMKSKKASATILQRKLRVGYARAARLLDILEREGIVSKPDFDNGGRKVLQKKAIGQKKEIVKKKVKDEKEKEQYDGSTPIKNLQQEEFCKLYVSRDYYGNGLQAYLRAYDAKAATEANLNVARSSASRLLTFANVRARLSFLLNQMGFNKENVDRHHLFLIEQFDDKNVKLGAIKEFNRIEGRVADTNLKIAPETLEALEKIGRIMK